MTSLTAIDLAAANRDLEHLDPFKRVAWARDTFGHGFCVTSSFGAQAAVMLHIVSMVDKRIPVLFLDTGYLFPETIAYREYLEKKLGLHIVTVKPELVRMEFEERFGEACVLDHDLCCRYNKVEPLRNALAAYTCWGTGIRRTQSGTRKQAAFLSRIDGPRPQYKLAPIADYNANTVALHHNLYGLAPHPLVKKGYGSIGCAPCTRLSGDGRKGRWSGSLKTECGLHLLEGSGDGI